MSSKWLWNCRNREDSLCFHCWQPYVCSSLHMSWYSFCC